MDYGSKYNEASLIRTQLSRTSLNPDYNLISFVHESKDEETAA
jgi:hypothetical protein